MNCDVSEVTFNLKLPPTQREDQPHGFYFERIFLFFFSPSPEENCFSSSLPSNPTLPVSCPSVGGVRPSGAQLVPVHPVVTRYQLLQGDEGLSQQGVLPESPVIQNAQVDHPLVQVPPGDPLVHKHLVVGGVTGASCCLGLPLAGLLGVREEVELHVGVRVCPVLQGLQSSYVHDHDEEFVIPVGDGEFDFTELFA